MNEFIVYSTESTPGSIEKATNIESFVTRLSENVTGNMSQYQIADINYLNRTKVGKYRLTIEYIEESPLDAVRNIVEKVSLNHNNFYDVSYGTWAKYEDRNFDISLTHSSMAKFLELEGIDKFKYFCYVVLTPTAEYKRSNITSKLIEIGRSTGVSISKSKANKNAFIVFNQTAYGDNGIIFFEDKEHYAGLKLGIDPVIHLSPLYSL